MPCNTLFVYMLTIHALLDVLKLVNCVLGLVDFLHLILQRRKQRKLYCYRHATHTCDKHGPSTYYAVSSIEEHTFEQQDIHCRFLVPDNTQKILMEI